jgi:hypothetical protein
MARINGVETCLRKTPVFRESGGYVNLSQWNYIMDNFTDKEFYYHWPMVSTVKQVLADFDKIVVNPKLKIIEPNDKPIKSKR